MVDGGGHRVSKGLHIPAGSSINDTNKEEEQGMRVGALCPTNRTGASAWVCCSAYQQVYQWARPSHSNPTGSLAEVFAYA